MKHPLRVRNIVIGICVWTVALMLVGMWLA